MRAAGGFRLHRPEALGLVVVWGAHGQPGELLQFYFLIGADGGPKSLVIRGLELSFGFPPQPQKQECGEGGDKLLGRSILRHFRPDRVYTNGKVRFLPSRAEPADREAEERTGAFVTLSRSGNGSSDSGARGQTEQPPARQGDMPLAILVIGAICKPAARLIHCDEVKRNL